MEKVVLQKLVEAGLSTRKIAEATGKGQTSVRYWLGKHGLQTTRIHKCKCGEEDPAKFHPGRFSECRKCRMKWQKDRFRKAKAFFVAYKGGKCELCGYNKCQASMDFHHKDPTQKDPNWKYMRRWSKKRVLQEIDKCMLVCRNCHGEIHFDQKV